MSLVDEIAGIIGAKHVLRGADMTPFTRDWTGKYTSRPRAVLRPGNTREVAEIVKRAAAEGAAIVPVGGNTGLAGGTMNEGALMISLSRLNRIQEINRAARTARVEAGVVLAALHEAAGAEGLSFPLTFGARGSATIGGVLSTNAGGSNVLRYGNARALCLGIEAVLPSGEVMDLMSPLHKDNTGYDLRDLMIGAEGTLGIITSAVLKLVPAPRAHATALVAPASLEEALTLLNRLQEESDGAVEAFEFMPGTYMKSLVRHRPDLKPPFSQIHEVNILVEAASAAPRAAIPGPDGRLPLDALLEDTLGEMLESGAVIDAVIAHTESQRAHLWAMREAAAEITFTRRPIVDNDIALPLDRVAAFFAGAEERLVALDPGAETISVAHLGDGNIHYAVYPTRDDPAHLDAIRGMVEDVVAELGGSFSAEHGIGLSKLATMARRKDRAALGMMRAIKAAVDPLNIMNPGKLLPGG